LLSTSDADRTLSLVSATRDSGPAPPRTVSAPLT
jgi:hypothetical protein